MTKECKQCSTQFEITEADRAFYSKIKIPEPTWCPPCRFRRRMAWANLRTLYMRKVGDKQLISMYSPDKQYNIVEDSEWWSDTHDFLEYGKEFDISKPFIEQFKELLHTVPLPHLHRNYATFENSDYSNAASNIKNCYLIAAADDSEDCAYCYTIEECKDSMDLLFTNRSELCYEGVNLKSCYQCLYCQDCENSNELILSRDCIGCNNCIGCINLKNKSYYIFNKPCSKEEYVAKLKEMQLNTYEGLQKIKQEAEAFFATQPRRFIHSRNAEGSSGDYIYQTKNVHDGFVVERAEDCRYVYHLRTTTTPTKDAYDYSIFGVGAELVYDSVWCGLGIHNVKFSFWCYGSADLEYCFGCHSSNNCFGCVGLRKKQYCILNKQYSKEEYFKKVEEIKEHMNAVPYVNTQGIEYKYGEFFPPELSLFNYNETLAQETVPLSKAQALELGFTWHDSEVRKTEHTLHWKDLPQIATVADSLTKELVLCKSFEDSQEEALEHNCTKVFKIIPQELALCEKLGVPLPRHCFNSRHAIRLKQMNPMVMHKGKCVCKLDHGHHNEGQPCSNKFETTYSPDRQEQVLCEQCYQKEVL